MNTPGPTTTSTTWAHRLASLISEIRGDWDEPGIRAALAQLGGKPLGEVALAAIAAAITRADQRSPAIIAMDGAHWRLLDPPGQQTRTDGPTPLTCEHGFRPSRCARCTAHHGVPCPPDLRAQIRADIERAQDRPQELT